MRIINATCCEAIEIGKQGEHLTTQVRFPIVNRWRELFGAGQFALVHKRRTDINPYAVTVTVDAGDVVWDVTSTDVAIAGAGKCELTYTVANAIAKSVTFATKTAPSLTDVGSEPPEPWESWVDDVLRAGEQAQEAAEDAEAAKEAAQSAAAEIEELTVTSHGIPAGETPTVEKTGGGGTPYNLDFGIPSGTGGASSWREITDKPFVTLGETLQVDASGVLNIVIPPEYGRVSYNGSYLTIT